MTKRAEGADRKTNGKSRGQRYEDELARYQVEISHLQAWVKETGARIVIIFEGRDAAGKGGVIKRLVENVSPRIFRVVALPTPSDREKTQVYMQRYIGQLPSGGEVVVFDRSWYNRAGVERVMGFCTPEQTERFLEQAPQFERWLVEAGVILIKFFLDVDEAEQESRFKDRIADPVRQWKLSPMDVESYQRWWDYSAAYHEMIARTHSEHAPWWIVKSTDKKAARLAVLKHILERVPYEQVPFEAPKFGKRQKKPKGANDGPFAGAYLELPEL